MEKRESNDLPFSIDKKKLNLVLMYFSSRDECVYLALILLEKVY
jgi:hypothetical protein